MKQQDRSQLWIWSQSDPRLLCSPPGSDPNLAQSWPGPGPDAPDQSHTQSRVPPITVKKTVWSNSGPDPAQMRPNSGPVLALFPCYPLSGYPWWGACSSPDPDFIATTTETRGVDYVAQLLCGNMIRDPCVVGLIGSKAQSKRRHHSDTLLSVRAGSSHISLCNSDTTTGGGRLSAQITHSLSPSLIKVYCTCLLFI